jgi:tetratricopeptide (TPR) repeat protein
MPVPGAKSKIALSVFLTTVLVSPLPALASNAQPQYMPPVAPEIDSSAFHHDDGGASSSSSYAKDKPVTSSGSGSHSGDYFSSNASSDANSNNDRIKGLLRQALQLHNSGDLNGAANLFHRVLTLDPHNSDANFNLGAMCEDNGDLNAALKYYRSAAAASPMDSDVHDALNAVNEKLRQQQATQQTAQQLQQRQQLRGVAQDAAGAYKSGNYDRAIADLQQVLRQSPNDPNALFGLAQAYRGKGDKAQAARYLNQALALAPDNQLYRATLSDLNNDRQQPGSALSADGGPQPAPDYNGSGGHHHHGNSSYGGGNNGSDDQVGHFYDDGNSNTMASQSNGGVTPFTDQGNTQLYGHASGNGGGMGGLGSGMGMGGLGMGMGLLGGLSRMGGGAYSGGSQGTRLVRSAVVGSLAGAAMGGLMNMNGAGGFRAGAMRGAAAGGLMGLITGF